MDVDVVDRLSNPAESRTQYELELDSPDRLVDVLVRPEKLAERDTS